MSTEGVELWPISIYMRDPITPGEVFHGRYILPWMTGPRLRLECCYVEHEGKTYYWYVPIPDNIELKEKIVPEPA